MNFCGFATGGPMRGLPSMGGRSATFSPAMVSRQPAASVAGVMSGTWAEMS
jgi:hypothetical protein